MSVVSHISDSPVFLIDYHFILANQKCRIHTVDFGILLGYSWDT